jgi:glycogen synthase
LSRDFSWNTSAREYGKIYERVRHLRSAETTAAVDLKREPVLG